MTRTHAELEALYSSYFSGNSRRDRGMSIGLPLAHWLLDTAAQRGAECAIDLGSGFSSLLFRWLGLATITLDGDEGWLDVTRSEMRAAGYGTGETYLLDGAERRRGHLVLLDLGAIPFRKGVGGAETRLTWAAHAAALVADTGVLVLDDWHHVNYATRMTARLAALGFTVRALPETTDEYGRFAAVAERAPVTRTADTGTRERGRFSWLRLETKAA